MIMKTRLFTSMRCLCIRLLPVLLFSLLLPVAHASRADALPEVSWQSLKFEAREFLGSGEVTIALSRLQDAAVGPALWRAEGYAPLVPERGLLKLDVKMSLMRNYAELQLWLDPVSFYMYQRWRYTRGNDSRLKTSHFLSKGVLWTRRDPKADNPVGAPDQWPVSRQTLIPYPATLNSAQWLDTTSLLLVASSAALKQPGDSVSVPVFTDQQAYRVTLRVEGRDSLATDYRLQSGDKEQRIKGKRQVLRIGVTQVPLQTTDEEPEFNLLGLTGDIRIYIDPERRIPVQLQGDASLIGRLDIKLKKAALATGESR